MPRPRCINLCWQHIDWERNCFIVVSTKTAKDRFIPMSQKAKRRLLELRLGRSESHIFPDLTKKAVSLRNAKLVRKAKIEDFYHDPHHIFATRLTESGADSFTMKALLDHSSIMMTERYTHPSAKH